MITPYLLPCASCGVHSKKFVESDPPTDARSPEDLARWTVRFHNHTNRLLRKNTVTYEEISPMYSRAIRGPPNHNILYKLVHMIADESNKHEHDSPYQIFLKEFFLLLPYVFPCIVCCENIMMKTPYRENKASLIWTEIGLSILKAHLPKQTDTLVFHTLGWKTDKGAGFMRLYSRQRSRIEVSNLRGGSSKIFRYFPVTDNRTYQLFIRGSTKMLNTVKIRLAMGKSDDLLPMNICCQPSSFAQNIFDFPFRTDIHLEFVAPEDEEFVRLEIFFAPHSQKGDRFILKDLQVSPFLEISQEISYTDGL